jgi:hypothetical protein
MTRARIYRLKNISVYVGLGAYVAMILTGDVILGAWGKLLSEMLRIPFYRYTKANDMAGMSLFFIVVSAFAILWSFL